MTAIPYLANGYLVLSSSKLDSIRRCPTYARYKYVEGRERDGVVAKGRDAGKALHASLEETYQICSDGKVGDTAVARGESALAAAYAGVEPVEGDEHLTLDRLQAVYRDYWRGCKVQLGKDGRNGTYTHAGYLQEPFSVLGVELGFAVRLGEAGGMPVYYTGYTDLLTRWHERGEMLVLDTKTMRRWDSSRITHWRMSGQPKGYASCLLQYLREGIVDLPDELREAFAPYEPKREQLVAAGVGRVDGFCLNAIVIRASTDLSRCKSPPTEYHRELYYYQDSQLAEWRANTLQWAETWLGWCRSQSWPMNDSQCANHFGRTCPYEGACSLPAEQRPLMLSTDMFRDVRRGWQKAADDATEPATT